MREIKFRAKAIDTAKWIFGNYFTAPLTIENFGVGFLPTPNGERIHCLSSDGVVWQVDEKTLGQFTGLKDKNGKEIYENDILRFPDEVTTAPQEILYATNQSGTVAEWRTRNARGWWSDPQSWSVCEVIGNIHEHPHLLKA